MPKSEKPPDSGAPAWMVTFGDMMSLLLCFFVILVALSEIKEDKFLVLVNSFRRYFGYTRSTGKFPRKEFNDVFHRLAALRSLPTEAKKMRGARARSLAGRSFRVTSIKKGERLTLNGEVSFELGSSELRKDAKGILDQIAELVRGYPNRIEVVGHTAREDKVDDPYQLSWDRARAVLEYLVFRGVKRQRLMAVGAGIELAGTRASLDDPRRIDIIVTEEVVKVP